MGRRSNEEIGELPRFSRIREAVRLALQHNKRKGGDVAKSDNDFGAEHKTKYPELTYQRQGKENWRLIDTDSGKAIGQSYPTKETLLADIDRQYKARFTSEPEPKHWAESIKELLTQIADHYEKTAPTVCDWANELYGRIGEDPDAVRLSELLHAENLREGGEWVHPNTAANLTYKLMNRLGQDTTGQAGF